MNILIIIQSETIGDVIKDFIAFGIIAEIDDIMAATLYTLEVDEEIDNADITYDK